MTRKITPQVEELLEMLIEECAEIQQIACKCLRHGMESYHPDDKDKIENWVHLLKEIGDARTIMWLIVSNHTAEVVGKESFSCNTGRDMLRRWERKLRWTHHQGGE